ncbi:spermine synthase-like isoform X2 [Ostrea edulis]|uniref:spermine synthase-like isoform X2 n=1 Tax=Ostrea edulis TaxID=37623 RepID=UPI0024AF6868|nr:spermine synthase-like isoform X2 [Ostrea edulis]
MHSSRFATTLYQEEVLKMGTATVMMCFTLKKETFDSEEAHALYHTIPGICFHGNAELQTVCDCGEKGDKMITATSDDGSHIVIHLYHFAYLTVDITFVVDDAKYLKPLSEPYHLEFIKELERSVSEHLNDFVEDCKSLCCPIRRAPGITWTYGYTGDERLLETDYEEILYETQSKWQNIKIARSREFGNVLLLDDDIMLGESDLIYTETLLGIGKNDFKNKHILILGGGDGGVLHELLKQSPANILMAEIDEEVVIACDKYLKKVCGDTMKKREGTNYKIKICDCVQELKDTLESGRKYDYIINDLTEFSVDKNQYGFSYQFETSCVILELSMKVLQPGGKYLARGNCLSARNYIKRFEKDVRALGLEFTRTDLHVPSFKETYCLYEVRNQINTDG